MDFIGTHIPLAEGDIDAEAQKLGCEPAAIWAVCDVESANSGFLADGRPQILFEAHYFHTLTGGRYDRTNPNISSPTWDRSLYGASGDHQYDRLNVAVALDETAALESASWGRFQIMGANFESCGYHTVQDFVQAMLVSEANHLDAFGSFCQQNGITPYLISHDWSHFALHYNGPGNVANYSSLLAAAYERHLSKNNPPVPSPSPGPSPAPTGPLQLGSQGQAVIDLQNDLNKLGANLTADGDFGPATEAAVKVIQAKYALPQDGIVGPMTEAVIQAQIKTLP